MREGKGKEPAGAISNATASEVRQEFAETLNRVVYRDETVLIERRGRPVAALISHKAFKVFLGLLDKLEDRLDSEAIVEGANESLLDFDVVVKELGSGDRGRRRIP